MKHLLFGLSLLLTLTSCSESGEEKGNPSIAVEGFDSLATLIDSTTLAGNISHSLQDDPHNYIGFGYLNQETNRVLLLGDSNKEDEADFTKVLDGDETWIELKSEGFQAATAEDQYRHTPYNFDNAAGHLFSMSEGMFNEWNTVLLVKDAFNDQHEVLYPAVPVEKVLTSNQKSQIEKARGRKIIRSSFHGEYNPGEFYFVEFEKDKDSLLVSLIWIDNDGVCTYLDFPAKADETSSWRVDDGGVFEFEYYEILAVIQGPEGIELATDWIGAEGSSISYLIQKDGIFQQVKSAYRYMAPM